MVELSKGQRWQQTELRAQEATAGKRGKPEASSTHLGDGRI